MPLLGKAVGLNIVYARPSIGATVALDDAVSRPIAAGDEYVYGLFGDEARRRFSHAAMNSDLSLNRPSYERAKLIVNVAHDPAKIFDTGVGLTGLAFFGKNVKADFRKAFQALFCDVVEQKYGDSPELNVLRAKDTYAGFRRAVLAFPECIAEAMDMTDIVVAVLPMRVRFGLVLDVSIVAKRVVSRLLQSIETVGGTERRYCISHADGRREMLVPPVLERPKITIDGRAGAVWRRGRHHPENPAVR